MVYVILRLIFGLWFCVTLGALAFALATILWGTTDGSSRWKKAGKRLVYGVIWPLALLTEKGRLKLTELY